MKALLITTTTLPTSLQPPRHPDPINCLGHTRCGGGWGTEHVRFRKPSHPLRLTSVWMVVYSCPPYSNWCFGIVVCELYADQLVHGTVVCLHICDI